MNFTMNITIIPCRKSRQAGSSAMASGWWQPRFHR